MKQNLVYLRFTFLLLMAAEMCNAQLCQNPTDTIYGLNSIVASGSGQIAGVQVFNGGTSLIGSPAASSANANGLGFSSATQKFYFFNQVGVGGYRICII